MPEIDLARIPTHVACVMDGNGRWAKARGLPRTEGHTQGEKALFDVVEGALELGVKWLTVYAFSTENWKRPVAEIKFLMEFNEKILLSRRDELHERGVRVRLAGRRERRVPGRVLKRIDEAIELTKDNTLLNFTLAFNYGGRAEIVDAVRSMMQTGVKANQVDEDELRKHLYVPDMPDPDLMIRSSGEHRISNFLLWEMAYSELVFTDVLWPDFRREQLIEAIVEYQQRDRRFGALKK